MSFVKVVIVFIVLLFVQSCSDIYLQRNYFPNVSGNIFRSALRDADVNKDHSYGYQRINIDVFKSIMRSKFDSKNYDDVSKEFMRYEGRCDYINSGGVNCFNCSAKIMWRLVRESCDKIIQDNSKVRYDEYIIPGMGLTIAGTFDSKKLTTVNSIQCEDITIRFLN